MLITSRENPLVKETKALISSSSERKKSGLFVTEGARLSFEAARNHSRIVRVFVTDEARKKYGPYVDPLLENAEEIFDISDSVSEKLSDTKTPQGVFAVCAASENEPDFSRDGLYVMLSELQDPGNIGTILRTCDACGVRGVIVSATADIYSPKVLRASMGCLFRLPIAAFPDSVSAVSELKRNGIKTYASALHKDAHLLPDVSFAAKSCILVGNEGNGLSDEVIEACDETVMIPMKGNAESLNAASAAAILIYSASEKI